MNPEIFNLPSWEGIPRCERCGIYMIGLLRSMADPSTSVPCSGGVSVDDDDSILDAEIIE